MSTILKNILQFTGLVVATPVSLPHRLNTNGIPVKPQLVGATTGGFTITADATNVTVTRTTGAAAVNIYVEHWHTIEDAEPPGGLAALIPFVLGGGSGGGGASGPPNAIGYFDTLGALVGDAAVWYIDPVTKDVLLGGLNGISRLYINQTGAFNSNAGIQHSSLVANRAQYRGNQFGANTGVPGITAFKSRGLTIGSLLGVIAGDVLFRATAIGVTGNNVDIPLAGTISINAALVAANYVATDFEVALVPLAGPINGRKEAFRVDSEGVLYVKEQANSMAGVAVLGAAGTVVIPNTRVKATTKFNLTAQDGGALLTGSLQQSARVVGTSFTIRSTAGAGDAGVQVYYQLFEPTIP